MGKLRGDGLCAETMTAVAFARCGRRIAVRDFFGVRYCVAVLRYSGIAVLRRCGVAVVRVKFTTKFESLIRAPSAGPVQAQVQGKNDTSTGTKLSFLPCTEPVLSASKRALEKEKEAIQTFKCSCHLSSGDHMLIE